MSPRMGRPKLDNPKSKKITIRIHESTDEFLNKYCKEHGIDKAEAIRLGIEKLKSDTEK